MNHCRTGFSLPEIIVSLLLVSFVLVALGGLLKEGVRFYTNQSVILEVQKNCVLAAQRLSKDLRESSVDSLDTTFLDLVIMGSPRDAEGRVLYDDGRLQWQKFVRFSVQNLNGTSVLVRDEDWLDSPTSKPPLPSFSDFSTLDRTAIQARHIESLDVNLTGEIAEVQIKAKYRDIFEMKLETQVKLRN